MVVDVANEASFSPEPVEEVLRALHSSQMANVHPRAWYARLLDRQFGMQTRSSDNKEWLKVRYNATIEKRILSRLLK
ncbi:hypothetical protein ACMYSQ_010249 [Aspergillus niger]